MAVGSDGVESLRGDDLGLEEIYYRSVGDAVYFASRIAPLLAVTEEPVETDWAAWADILAFGYPVGERTPFRQIRRMTPGMAWRAGPGSPPRRHTTQPFWTHLVSRPAVSPQEMVTTIEHAIPRVSTRRSIVLLSGGWDSRILAGLVRRANRRRPVAWTTSTDDGLDLDLALAAPVAQALGMPHRTLVPNRDAFRAYASETRGRVQFQTWMHTWLTPLARRLRDLKAPIIDGLAGDVLLKSLYVDGSIASIPGREDRIRAVWSSLSKGAGVTDQNVFTDEIREFVTETSWRSFRTATEAIPEHPGDATLAVLLTRTMRGIASSPIWIFGPELAVRMPFAHPAVVSAALTVPIADKSGGAYYRRLLDEAAGVAARLPSTNDATLATPPRGPRRQSQPEALAWMASVVRSSDDAIDLLSPRMRKAVLEDPEDLDRLCGFSVPMRMLQIASMLAEWQREYAIHLSDVGSAPWRQPRAHGRKI